MENNAAVLFKGGTEWKVVTTELDAPQPNEVLVRIAAAGLCHSDEHLITGDGRMFLPLVGGHEGAGVVESVGERVVSLTPGDHVVLSWIPSCGRCRMCVTGFQMLCDAGAWTPEKSRAAARHHYNGDVVYTFGPGAFSEYAVAGEESFIKIPDDIPLPVAALVGCGVTTGWGSSVHRAEVGPGDVVVVVGVGGLGTRAVQGAKLAGARHIVAIDPVEFKRQKVMEFGATHTSTSMEAAVPLVTELTRGLMADKVIMTPSVLYGDLIEPAMALVRKGGTVVAAAVAPWKQRDIKFDLFTFAMYQKELKGTVYGNSNPRHDIPFLLNLYQNGLLKLEEMITRTYTLDQINDGFQDMRDGLNIRGVIIGADRS